MSADENQASAGALTVHLLDSSQAHPVQTWHFQDNDTIMIGRGPDNDINIADPQVSRCHVVIRFCDGQWLLISFGRNGTRANGTLVTESPIVDQQTFQLGTTGPSFKVYLKSETGQWTETIDSESMALDELFIDAQKQREQVEEIVEGTAFQQLQKQVREFRNREKADDTKVN